MRVPIALALMMLAGCHREPDFDERYASAEAALRGKAAAIDSEIAARESEASAADAVASGKPRSD